MLSNLSIKNYALIDKLNVSFDSGFTCITGETGAGKSILLGGLSLVLGKRADLSTLRNKDLKCVIEAEFGIDKYNLKPFFKTNDLDFEKQTIIRREIHPSGKSRAFINDTPVTLDVLSQLGNKLIDVHSQHQTLQLADNDFQLKMLDALAENQNLLTDYSKALVDYNKTSVDLNELVDIQNNANKELDYNSFLLTELQALTLEDGIQEELESQYEQLNNVETITEELSKSHHLLNDEQMGVVTVLSQLKQIAGKLTEFGSGYTELYERINSAFIELDDISSELEGLQENIEANPQLLEEVNGKLQRLYDLQKKHSVSEISELIAIREELAGKVGITENIEEQIREKENLLAIQEKELENRAGKIRDRRRKIIPSLKKQLEEKLSILGMPSVSFKIEVNPSDTFKSKGKDDLIFLFSANKGSNFGELKKVASGGELSRIMLTIKSILAKYEQLPTMMFDEIDSGVSGEISNKMGDIMLEMSKTMQVFSITHLPQVASKGHQHFKVFKEENGQTTNTQMRKLNTDERVVELAEMLGGKDLSDSALAHAKQLLN
ncbi:DNA repair protein RecN [Aurantibacter crassamenti]|uniref:DNA repair protein RecN n=1 Tax=Aurantibacter crassamenti TaxID=1837375 RepID=UPI00193A9BBD|nr:DNA repair protein RecN [Aurantibacter crassamenti]MBM1107496.1 DNA repair protein RecN [Aurantibacter crassamenti]